MSNTPPLNEKQFIVSTDTRFGYRDYFLCEAIEKLNGYKITKGEADITLSPYPDYSDIIKDAINTKVWTIKRYEGKEEINIDDWIDYLKGMEVDHSTDKMTAYCRPGVNFRDWWKSLPVNKKSRI